jgi:hypothetical protein
MSVTGQNRELHGIVLPERLQPLTELLQSNITVERACKLLANAFGVQPTEVALLRVDGTLLRFLYPEHLQSAGGVPVANGSVAGNSAMSKKAEIFNNFARVTHARMFEFIKPSGSPDHFKPLPIQKLMSAPILGKDGIVLGVIQISRKGHDAKSVPDFTRNELHHLELATAVLAGSSLLAKVEATAGTRVEARGASGA